VAAAAHGHLEAERVGQLYGIDHVSDATTAGDEGRTFVVLRFLFSKGGPPRHAR
jgi:hypothetical protein